MNRDQTAPTGMEHSKVIARAAKETLSPLGIFRMGRSRTWIDDHGWWLAVIEFQPSGFSKGAYLNVGAMWLWHEKDYFTFDFANGNGDAGCRVANHIEYKDEEQFTPEAMRLASLAKDEVISLRRKLVSIHDAARYLPGKAVRDGSPWTHLSAAIALGYAGRTFRARWLFKSLERKKAVHDWEVRLKESARGFADVLNQPCDFQRYVKDAIWRTRRLLKLPERTELDVDQEQSVSLPRRFRFPFRLPNA